MSSISADADSESRNAAVARRHDLDALRAFAMLLGMAYHSALSFALGPGWLVQDLKQSKMLYLFQAFVHGFRMQLFMLVSGFFTCMLWKRLGLKGLLVNRFRRVLLPCLAGLCTVVPAVHWAGAWAQRFQGVARQMPLRPLPVDLELSGLVAGSASFGEIGGRVFVLVWFLWFLVWLTPFFLLYAIAVKRFAWKVRPHVLLVSQWSTVWLVPLTIIPALRMGMGGSDFGPETSMGVLPAPRVLCYYAVFFSFGVLYHECGDAEGQLGRSWRWTLPLTLLVIFPFALEVTSGVFGIRDVLLPKRFHRPAGVCFQVLFAWMMCFGAVGCFRSLLTGERRWIRYISDASFWCYLAHLPVVILIQGVVCSWALPAVMKFLIVFCSVSLLSFMSYEKWVRERWIGKFLRGQKNPPI